MHHILSDSVYTGTVYANRYEYVAAKKPRACSSDGAPKNRRRPKPKEQWIAIPVPALVDQDTWDRAQAQLARNATLSFRNNQKHDYPLRRLLGGGPDFYLFAQSFTGYGENLLDYNKRVSRLRLGVALVR